MDEACGGGDARAALTPSPRMVKGGPTLADGVLPGWEACRLALSPIWPYEGVDHRLQVNVDCAGAG